ncbi:BLOC-1-related complex subunit 5-like [Clavelina lepadiformis]|uniref:BLOC-1-related complex subunit 5-like n=1 Tax=Clavelina lepadiformis TaxID=159417 RepID=UPI004042C127
MGNESSSERKVKETGVVVVTSKKDKSQEDQHIAQLSYCPTFRPLLESSLNIPESRPLTSELVGSFDQKSCLQLCVHLQNHLQECSETVKVKQFRLATQIKEVDRVASAVMQKLTERQRAFAKHAEHARKIDDISNSLKRLRINLSHTLDLANELNMLLPEDRRLITFKI